MGGLSIFHEGPSDPNYLAENMPNPYAHGYKEADLFPANNRTGSSSTNPYRQLTRIQLQHLGLYYGISNLMRVKTKYAYQELADKIQMCYIYKHPYMDWSHEDLIGLVRARNLLPQTLPPSRSNRFLAKIAAYRHKRAATTSKSALVAVLEDADAAMTFNLMGLPLELRRIIYRFAFLQVHATRLDTTINDAGTSTFSLTLREPPTPISAYNTGEGRLLEPAFLRLNHEIRDEALPIFYATRRFPITCIVGITDGPFLYGRPVEGKPLPAIYDLQHRRKYKHVMATDKLRYIRHFSAHVIYHQSEVSVDFDPRLLTFTMREVDDEAVPSKLVKDMHKMAEKLLGALLRERRVRLAKMKKRRKEGDEEDDVKGLDQLDWTLIGAMFNKKGLFRLATS